MTYIENDYTSLVIARIRQQELLEQAKAVQTKREQSDEAFVRVRRRNRR